MSLDNTEVNICSTQIGLPADSDLLYISQIPPFITAANLRTIFSQFVEADAFVFFHYRRRPDSAKLNSLNSVSLSNFLRYIKRRRNPECSSCSVPVVIKKQFSERFSKLFDDLWQTDDVTCTSHNTRLIKIDRTSEDCSNLEKRLSKLLEFSPPSWMSQGNVGTNSSSFFALIRECKLSPAVIKSLQLSFPRSKNIRKYGAVSFNYCSEFTETAEPSTDDESEVYDVRSICYI